MRNTAKTFLIGCLMSVVASGCFSRGGFITVDAVFADVGDLARYAQVQASDVKIGDVVSIRLEGFNARIRMRLDSSARLSANSMAFVRSTSLLGERLVEIRPPLEPESSLLKDGDVIPLARTGIAPTLDEAFIKLGELLEGGSVEDLAVFVGSAAEIVRDREAKLGDIFAELAKFSGTLAGRSPEIASAIESLDSAFGGLASSSETVTKAISSSADATNILSNQQRDLDKLVDALDRFAAVSVDYSGPSTPSSDRALKDLHRILGELSKTTGDLDASLSALARFSALWPKVIPGDHVQLDVVINGDNSAPASASSRTSPPEPVSADQALEPGPVKIADFLRRALR